MSVAYNGPWGFNRGCRLMGAKEKAEDRSL